MSEPPIYLDCNSTTPIDPRVVEAMQRAWRECRATPASQHAAGRKARRVLEEAREAIAELLGAKTGGVDADQVIFTSGGTEANNLAILGLSPLIFVSAIEHPSIMQAAAELRRRGGAVRVLPVKPVGQVFLPAINESGRQECLPHLVSVMLANNETGAVQPVSEVAEICHQRGALVHTDAVQAVGKISVHFRDLGVDAMTVAPHKFHGPLGIGGLVIRHGLKLRPQLFGGLH